MEPVTLVDRYQLQHQISSKSGRKTYRAIDLQTQMPVMVKLLVFEEGLEWASLRLFEREVEVLKSLDHPNIPSYIDSFELNLKSRKGFGLVQAYLELPSLEEHLRKGRVFSEADTRELAISMLEILSYLHQKSPPVVHRDIKPSNVLLGDRSGHSIGQVYLVDFGVVQTVNTNHTITVVGTYGYMPPEQFWGRSSPVSDLYSLGATLLYVVTGQQPAELMTDDLQLDFGSISNISTEFEVWIRKMIASVPSQRFASARDAIDALSSCDLHSITDLEIEWSKLAKEKSLDISLIDFENLEKDLENLEDKLAIDKFSEPIDPANLDFQASIDYAYSNLQNSPYPYEVGIPSLDAVFNSEIIKIRITGNNGSLNSLDLDQAMKEIDDFACGKGIYSNRRYANNILNPSNLVLLLFLYGTSLLSAPHFLSNSISIIILGYFSICIFLIYLQIIQSRRLNLENTQYLKIGKRNAIFVLNSGLKTAMLPRELISSIVIDGCQGAGVTNYISIYFLTSSQSSYTIRCLDEESGIDLAIAIASWLEVDLHDRRITFDDQKLIPISHFDRDSWKRYSTEE